MTVLLLPGMDGTGDLFGPLQEQIPGAEVCRYPSEPLGYAELEALVRSRFDHEVVLAESFSGPIGYRLACDPPPGLKAVVLVATFRRGPPLARLGARMGRWPFLVVPPRPMVRHWMLDGNSSTDLVCRVQEAMRSIPAATMAARLGAVSTVNEMGEVAVPTLVIDGLRDRWVPPQIWPGCEIQRVDGPHLLCQTRPAEIAARIHGFTRRP